MSEIHAGTRVLSSNGKFNEVRCVLEKNSDKTFYKIHAKYQAIPNIVTEDHEILVWDDHSIWWKKAKDIQPTDMLLIPKITGRTRAISRVNKNINDLLEISDIWRLIGYWLAEGAYSASGNEVRLVFGEHELNFIEDCRRIISRYLTKSIQVRKNSKGAKIIVFAHKDFKEILNKFGTKSYTKHLPPFALNTFDMFQRELIVGYFRGDGCLVENAVCFSSTSYSLLAGIQLILANWNIASGISQSRKAGRGIIVGVKCKIRAAFNLTTTSNELRALLGFSYSIQTKPSRSFFTDKFWVVPIKKIRKLRRADTVFDIEVMNVHDFYMPGMIAHNCIICDDLNSPNNSQTKEGREKVIQHYRYLTSILEPQGTLVVVGTRYSADDCIGTIMRNEIGLLGG